MATATLARGTLGPRYACGFYCNGNCESYLFAIFIVQTNSIARMTLPTSGFPQVVWSANRNKPIKTNATLQFTAEGDLVLRDADGTLAWSTNTAGKSVAGLNLTDEGNLVLFDSNNETVWQSFDHPTDALVPGQKLVSRMKLTASVSRTNWTEGGLFAFAATDDGLVAFVQSNPPQTYFERSIEGLNASGGSNYVMHLNGSLALFSNSNNFNDPLVTFPPAKKVSSAQYMKLESDGHLKVYEWNIIWNEIFDVNGYLGLSILGIIIGIAAFIFLKKKKTKANEDEEDFLDHVQGMPTRFSYDDLKAATENFTKKLGEGGFGSVFEGRRIIQDIAKGLSYLHEECSQKILHLDIKPPNILLDEKYNAKLSDFGLAKLIDRNQSQVMTMMRGTPGYLAPEWLSGIITEKVDVYSFGIVILEILSGRRHFEASETENQQVMVNLFRKKAEKGQLADLIGKHSDDMLFHKEEVIKMMQISAWCLQSDHTKRPSMSMVVKSMEGVLDVEKDLDYSFRPQIVNGIPNISFVDSTPLVPSVLSGPR
ncbi:hypothetical protein P3S67_016511 [Capsicum chacoense]